jgi:hypothetical protein
LVDSQAGCWGIRASALGNVNLSASDYELEFDLLSSLLLSGMQPVFSDPLVGDQRIGADLSDTIDHRRTVRKMPFILYKCGWSKQKLSNFLTEYCDTYRASAERTLPDEYVAALNDWIAMD